MWIWITNKYSRILDNLQVFIWNSLRLLVTEGLLLSGSSSCTSQHSSSLTSTGTIGSGPHSAGSWRLVDAAPACNADMGTNWTTPHSTLQLWYSNLEGWPDYSAHLLLQEWYHEIIINTTDNGTKREVVIKTETCVISVKKIRPTVSTINYP